MTWLVTGGAGYIGAHVVAELQAAGASVVVLDDLSTGDAGRITGVPLVVGTAADRDLVVATIAEHAVTGVMHVAGKKQVEESVHDPLHYYDENVSGMVSLLQACRDGGVSHMVFSSSAATYGQPDADLVTEDTPTRPMSPYGETKLVGEWLVRDCARAWGLSVTSLRYFNVAGAGRPDLADTGVSNLVPRVFRALDRGEAPTVFGDQHATADGTCVRDYVHVQDIARAHAAAALALEAGSAGGTYNVGRGVGASVLEVLATVAEVTGLDVIPRVSGPRAGDAASVVAAVDRITDELGFRAEHDLHSIIASAWDGWRHHRSGAPAGG